MELVLGKLETLDNPSTIFRNPPKVPLLGIVKKRVVLTKYENAKITSSECAEVIKKSQDTALRELTRLLSLGLINRQEIGKAIYYVLIKF